MKLIIAEKPELGRDIARAVAGAPAGARLPYEGNGYRVVACRGHLIEDMEPAEIDPERWADRRRLDVLPILAKPWPKKPKEGCEQALADIRRGLAECDGAINAGDPDDEGQMLVDEVIDYFGYKGPVERVYVNNNLDAEIKKAFEHLKPNDPCRADGRAAAARSIADFCFGVNESRLISIKAGGGSGLKAGRVKSPTLGLVVRRDEEIMGHKASEYFTASAKVSIDGQEAVFDFKPAEDLLDDDGKRCTNRGALEAAVAGIGPREGGCATGVSIETKPAPLPYNLTDLTADMSRRYKMSAQKVMDATQSLRERHKAITYNRSDCNYLPLEAHAQAPDVLGRAMRNIGASWELDFSRRGRCFDDSSITAHTGIIPQATDVDVAALTADERKVYTAIAERYAQQFAPDAEWDVSVTEIAGPQGKLVHRAKRVRTEGWRAICDSARADRDVRDGWIEAGEHRYAIGESSVEARKTKPKPPYTSGTLVKDMSSIAKYVEDPELRAVLKKKDEGKKGEHGGIGTTATRAKVIEDLISSGYLEEKSGRIYSTTLGREVYHAYPPEIRGADLTAKWYLMCEEVRAGRADVYSVAESVCEEFRRHRDTAYGGVSISARGTAVGTCPVCGKPVIDRGAKYKTVQCSSNRFVRDEQGGFRRTAGCGFSMWKKVAGKRLTDKQISDLLATGRTAKISGFRSKAGKTFSARLVLKGTDVAFEFDDGRKGAGRAGR